MGETKPSYRELEARLLHAERTLRAIGAGEIDSVIGEKGVYYLRLRELENELDLNRIKIEEMDLTLNTLMECVPEGVTIASAPDVNILRVSDYGKNLLGKPGEILENIPAEQHVANWDIYKADGKTRPVNEDLPLTRAVRHGETVKDEEWVLGASGGVRIPIICNAAPIKKAEGKIIGGIMAWRDISRRKKAEEELKSLNLSLEEKVRERTAELRDQFEQRKYLARNLVRLLERERSEIAMNLHDHAGQVLTALRMDIDFVQEELPPGPATEKLESCRKMTGELMDFIRNISHTLRPPSLEKLGLTTAIRALIEDIKIKSGISIRFFTRGISRLHPEKELAIYRVIQESINNIIKHSGADEAFVNLVLREGNVILTIEDNGSGFDYEPVKEGADSQKGSLGLIIMKERIVQAGGELWIETEKGKGTLIAAEIPLTEEHMETEE